MLSYVQALLPLSVGVTGLPPRESSDRAPSASDLEAGPSGGAAAGGSGPRALATDSAPSATPRLRCSEACRGLRHAPQPAPHRIVLPPSSSTRRSGARAHARPARRRGGGGWRRRAPLAR